MPSVNEVRSAAKVSSGSTVENVSISKSDFEALGKCLAREVSINFSCSTDHAGMTERRAKEVLDLLFSRNKGKVSDASYQSQMRAVASGARHAKNPFASSDVYGGTGRRARKPAPEKTYTPAAKVCIQKPDFDALVKALSSGVKFTGMDVKVAHKVLNATVAAAGSPKTIVADMPRATHILDDAGSFAAELKRKSAGKAENPYRGTGR